MRFAVVHNEVKPDALPDEADVLVQAKAVCCALEDNGDEAILIPCSLDLSQVKQKLEQAGPDMAVNLVESLDGQGRLIHLLPCLLDAMNLPYTGSGSMAMFLTSNKIAAKRHMRSLNLPTPPWIGPVPGDFFSPGPAFSEAWGKEQKWLMKSVWEHASIGLDEHAAVSGKSSAQMMDLLALRRKQLGGDWFCEPYIDGREFNISILGRSDGPIVLPSAEIVFEGFPETRLKIVGYHAKWDPDSYEYHHTPRRFDFPDADGPLLLLLKETALKCWHCFGLNGYARVDFRVDASGRPWILEINANPCLSPDAGFAAAAARAGLRFSEAVYHIVADAKRKNPDHARPGGQLQSPAPQVAVSPVAFRYDAFPEDVETIARLTRETGFFREDEIEVAVELVCERLKRGSESGYHFVFALQDGLVAGYTCFGPIACTVSSYDLFWIVVSPGAQRQKIGQKLLAETEKLVQKAGGTRLYVETSYQDQYESTRFFYERCGYRRESVLADFYAPGDGKATYCKCLYEGS
jgi:D-alanine-D-alanine ligase